MAYLSRPSVGALKIARARTYLRMYGQAGVAWGDTESDALRIGSQVFDSIFGVWCGALNGCRVVNQAQEHDLVGFPYYVSFCPRPFATLSGNTKRN